MPPQGTKHRQNRSSTKKNRLSQQKIDDLKAADDTSQESGLHITSPGTTITTTKYPVFETLEQLESAEAEEITHKHRHTIGWLLPETLPVLVHVAAPQAGRFTREVQSDIGSMNSIEAVKDLVKNSLVFELRRTNIDIANTRFAGLMVYGPTTEFKPETIKSFTHGLFLQEAAFKKWWLSVNMSQRVPGDMVKIAVVLWHAAEAAAKQVDLPNFWTDETARILGNHLEKLEIPVWDPEIEKGCRNYAKMQQQVLEARMEVADAKSKAMKADDSKKEWQREKKELNARCTKLTTDNKRLEQTVNKLTKLTDGFINAIEAQDTQKAARLADDWQKTSKRNSKAKVEELVDGGETDDDDEESDEDEDVEMADAGDDLGDSD